MHLARLCLFALLPLGSASADSASPAAPRVVGRIEDARLRELSGLAASRFFPGWTWAHNDSGDVARLFLLDTTGRTRATVIFPGVRALDWEDIAVAGGRFDSHVTVADCGDNTRERREITFLRFRERDLPPLAGTGRIPEWKVAPQVLRARFPASDGPQDAEAIAANARGELLLVTKSMGASRFYLLRWPSAPQPAPMEMKFVGERAFGAPRRVRERLVTGGSLAPDERTLALVTYASLHLLSVPARPWSEVNWRQVLAAPTRTQVLPALPQCEAVAWRGASEVLVASEGVRSPLWAIPTAGG